MLLSDALSQQSVTTLDRGATASGGIGTQGLTARSAFSTLNFQETKLPMRGLKSGSGQIWHNSAVSA